MGNFTSLVGKMVNQGEDFESIEKFINELTQATEYGLELISKIKDFEPAVVSSLICTLIDMYAHDNGLDSRDFAKEICISVITINNSDGPMEY